MRRVGIVVVWSAATLVAMTIAATAVGSVRGHVTDLPAIPTAGTAMLLTTTTTSAVTESSTTSTPPTTDGAAPPTTTTTSTTTKTGRGQKKSCSRARTRPRVRSQSLFVGVVKPVASETHHQEDREASESYV